jgi:hypothetical protein
MSHDRAQTSHDSRQDPDSAWLPRGRAVEEDSDDSIRVQAQLVDPEMSRLGGQMDVWCHELKRNIMVKTETSITRPSCSTTSERKKSAHKECVTSRCG